MNTLITPPYAVTLYMPPLCAVCASAIIALITPRLFSRYAILPRRPRRCFIGFYAMRRLSLRRQNYCRYAYVFEDA